MDESPLLPFDLALYLNLECKTWNLNHLVISNKKEIISILPDMIFLH